MNENGAIVTDVDVVNCYRIFLGREPEAAEIIQRTVDEQPRVWDLIRRFLNSNEAVARQFTVVGERISRGRYGNRIEVDGTPDQIEALFKHVRQVWAKYGDEEPFWSVLTGPEFLRSAMNPTSEEVFYRTGRASCDLFADACSRNAITRPTSKRVVDFGCGVGRLGEHLSHDFAYYTGVDISRPHLELAKSRMQHLGRINCEFLLLPEFFDSTARYDAFMSLIVLQHNPPPVMHQLLNSLLSRLNSKGVGYFQLPCFLFNYDFRLPEYLEMITKDQSMEMHALPQQVVFKSIADSGCKLIEATLDGLIGSIGLSYTFLVQKL